MAVNRTVDAGDGTATLVRDLRQIDWHNPERAADVLRYFFRSAGDWLDPRVQQVEPHRLAIYPLLEDRNLSMVSVVLAPGGRPPIHDHTAWCVLGVYRGKVRDLWFRQMPSTGRVIPDRVHVYDRGTVVVLPAHQIHTAEAIGVEPAVTIQIYGTGLVVQAGSEFDPGSGEVRRYAPLYRRPHTRNPLRSLLTLLGIGRA